MVFSTLGACWLAIIVEDAGHYIWGFFLMHKFDIAQLIIDFNIFFQTQFSIGINFFFLNRGKGTPK